jgi:flavin-dependent dehydrogenase
VTGADGTAAPGVHVDRARLHDRLRRAARRAGARLCSGAQAVGVLGGGDGVRGLRTTRGEVASRWVIDASGRRQWLARHLGLSRRRAGPRRLVAWGAASDPFAAGESRFDASARGWTWWAPVGAGVVSWVRCATTPRGLTAPPTELAVRGASRARCGADLSWRLVRPAAGNGFLLCGDAALLLDPSFGDGVERALRTGTMAAGTALDALRRPELASVLVARYDDALVRAFDARVRSRDATTGL